MKLIGGLRSCFDGRSAFDAHQAHRFNRTVL
jgi:hypothetical protein